jgi:hypothetical protein
MSKSMTDERAKEIFEGLADSGQPLRRSYSVDYGSETVWMLTSLWTVTRGYEGKHFFGTEYESREEFEQDMQDSEVAEAESASERRLFAQIDA